MLSLQGPFPHQLQLLFFGACFTALPLIFTHLLGPSLSRSTGASNPSGQPVNRSTGGRFHGQLRGVGVKSLKPQNLFPLVNLDRAILAHQMLDMAARLCRGGRGCRGRGKMSHLSFI